MVDKIKLFDYKIKGSGKKLIIDSITRKMMHMFVLSKPIETKKPSRLLTCSCGAYASSKQYVTPEGYIINGFAIHYVACHRKRISEEDIQLIKDHHGKCEPHETMLNHQFKTIKITKIKPMKREK